ncbi:FMN-binding negative transcriptional regulator [Rhodococcus fascians]|nr:FMN-binding negative transcriptional regulator [Rhodococcus fascians]MBY4114649.1 FMN-binding negative transcriptional regulator [Rhodococcus fascians]
MFIQPWDDTLAPEEWRNWLATTDRFGTLIVGNTDPDKAPLAVPTHFTMATDDRILIHLARPNPIWPHLVAATEVRLSIIGNYAYIPTYWRAKDDIPPEQGVPTSYYAAVQFVCAPAIIDDPQEKANLLAAQLDDLQPEGQFAAVSPDAPPYGRMLPGIRGLSLDIIEVNAKFKFDDAKPVEFRQRIAANLDQRAHSLDASAATQQRRRLGAIGEWKDRHES